MSAAQLLGRAEMWRPWRAYAAQHLWVAMRHNTSENESQPRHVSFGFHSRQQVRLGTTHPVQSNHRDNGVLKQ